MGTGNVGIGTTSPDTFKLQIAGNVGPNTDDAYNLGAAGSDWGCLYYNGGTLGTCASDERLKDDIEELSFGEDPLAIVEALSVRQFSFKSDETDSLYHGLIAQEVFDIAPALVVENPDGFLAVKYGDIQWVVVSAVQQISRMMREQTATVAGILERLSGHDTEIERLRNEIDMLRTQVNDLGGQGGGGADENRTGVPNVDGGTEEAPDEEVIEGDAPHDEQVTDDSVSDGETGNASVEETIGNDNADSGNGTSEEVGVDTTTGSDETGDAQSEQVGGTTEEMASEEIVE